MEGADVPDLIWQHEYNKKWFTYSVSEHKAINKAYKKNQKTVTLPFPSEKKKVVLHLLKMYQVNSETGFEQRVRCVIYDSGFYVWKWQGDRNDWNSYTPRITCSLEIAYHREDPKVKFYLNGDYEVDMNSFKQLNVDTGFIRNVQRERIHVDITETDTAYYSFQVTADFEVYLRNASASRDSRSEKVIFEVSELPADKCAPDSTTSFASCSGLLSENLSLPDVSQIIEDKSVSLLNSDNTTLKVQDKKSIPIDSVCEEKANYHIYCEDSVIFSAMLNLTNLQNNNNKFYIIQLIEHNTKKIYCVWYRWGRVGNKGSTNLQKFGNVADAKAEFEKKFYDKTHNEWLERNNFQKVAGKYDLLQMDIIPEVKKKSENVPILNLDPKVQSLFEIICDKKVMEEIMSDMFYDSNKAPLGKLTAKQMAEGYLALDKIASIINQKGRCSALINACNEFYTKIPHNFGRRVPPIIQTHDDIREKISMMETLSNINEAMTVMEIPDDENADPLYKYYKSLNCNLNPLARTSKEFIALEKYLMETHGPTHSAYTMEIVDVFKCSKETVSTSMNHLNGMLLWHGSRITNWLGILKRGLRIAPPEAPQTGYMFGKGIYFADSSSKSANYCFATKKKNEGLLLLCEVFLGTCLELKKSTDMPRKLPAGYHSVKGLGRIAPQNCHLTALSDKATVPEGPFVEKMENGDFDLIYNEYVVYDPGQVKMKYLVRVKFNFH